MATLELFVHVNPTMLPANLIAVCAHVPDSVSVEQWSIADLPKHWRRYPAPAKLKRMGTDWAIGQSSLVLKVPSAITPSENNILLNPLHREIKKLKIVSVNRFRFDPRMFS